MFRIWASIILLIGCQQASGQTLEDDVSSHVDAVSIDSLVLYVSELSGALPMYVGDTVAIVELVSDVDIDTFWVADTLVRLPNRVNWNNDAATAYLVRKLKGFGYDSVVVDSYPDNTIVPATDNVIAFKPGSEVAGPTWLIGAHYDSVLPAPGADDNASGTAAVLEAARVLAGAEFRSNVIFALWDTEEAGLIGSDLFAGRVYDEGLRIDGVLNLDMIGWDGDKDRVLELHADGPSFWIAKYLFDVSSRYGLNLNPRIEFPGIGRSDHMSFRKWEYPAILLIEEVADDFNPYYHSIDDVIGAFDLNFYHEAVKLAVAALAQLSTSGTTVAVDAETPVAIEIKLDPVYPNPARDYVEFRYAAPPSERVSLTVVDLLGRTVETLVDERVSAIGEVVQWRIRPDLPGGLYFAVLRSSLSSEIRPFVVIR